MRNNPRRSPRHRRISRRVNGWMLAGYAIIAPAAVVLKAWETVQSRYPVGWLAKTNAVAWETVTLAGALGALALGVREMVLAYFMRKEYEEDLAALLQNQQAQAEMVKAQAEAAREQSETVQAILADARAQREAEAARAQEQNVFIQQLLEQNRQLMERLDRRDDGHNQDNHQSEH